MKQSQCISLLVCILSTAQISFGMHQQPKEYQKTIENGKKALIVIEMLAPHCQLKLKPSHTEKLKIKARVPSNAVQQQEKQYTELPFYPFFVDETEERITIKPHIAGGVYTVYVSKETFFNPDKTTAEIPASLLPFKKSTEK